MSDHLCSTVIKPSPVLQPILLCNEVMSKPTYSLPHRFTPATIRQYDIRGTVGCDLHAQDAYILGLLLAESVLECTQFCPAQTRVTVGRDGRLSSPMLAEALIDGITDTGVAVISLPSGPTPMLYFADLQSDTQAAVMVTGSHNPPDMNGFKIIQQHRPLFGEALRALTQRGVTRDATAQQTSNKTKGDIEVYDCRMAYMHSLQQETQRWPKHFRPRVAWDAGNGATGEVLRLMTQQLPGEHFCLHTNIDGRFPHHHPDPTIPENLEDLSMLVRQQHCDVGFAFDGDGDRLGVITAEGDILWGDRLMMMWAEEVLTAQPGATIMADVKSSDTLFRMITSKGGVAEICQTGHAPIKARMRENGALLGGEMSGHIFFADRHPGYDDGLYAAIRVLTSMATRQQSLGAIMTSFPVAVSTPEVRLPCAETHKAVSIARIKQKLRQQGIDFFDLDGIRVTTPEGWWLVRASHTEPMLVLRAEAESESTLKALWVHIMQYIIQVELEPVPYDTLYQPSSAHTNKHV